MRIRLIQHLAVPLGLAVAAVLGGSPQADAGFQVTLRVGASSFTAVDGGAGDDDTVAFGADVANQITILSRTVDGYTFTLTLSTTNTSGGTIAFVNSGTNSIRDTSNGSSNVKVSVIASADGFTSPTAPPTLTAFSGSTAEFLALTPTGNSAEISYSAFAEEGGTVTDSATPGGLLIGSDGPETITQASDPSAALSDQQNIASLGSPYALHLVLMALFDEAGSNIDLDGQVLLTQAIPEPGTIAMALSALPLLGCAAGYRRWRRREQA